MRVSLERTLIIMKILACEGAANIYQLRKKLGKELGMDVDYHSVYRYVKILEKNGMAEFVKDGKRKAKKYYLTDKGLVEARKRGYINFEEWTQRLIEYTHWHYIKNTRKLFRLAKKSRIISTLLDLFKGKSLNHRKRIFYSFNIAIQNWEIERYCDVFMGEEKSSEYYIDKLNRTIVGEIFAEVLPTMTIEDKLKLVNIISKEDLNYLKDIIKERMEINEKIIEMYRQIYSKYDAVLKELEAMVSSV